MQVEMPKKAPKKGALATPNLYVYAKDDITDKPVVGARVKVQDKTGKTRIDKYTDEKRGRVYRALVPGPYTINVSHNKYLPIDTIHFEHRDDYDTVYVALHPKHSVRWLVVDDYTSRPIKANYEIQSVNHEVNLTSTTDSACYVVSTLDDRMSYKLNITADGYEPFVVDMERVFDNNYVVRLKPVELKTFVLQNMYFATAKTTVLPSSAPALEMLYELLSENPNLTIRIIGHTDDVGPYAANDVLSEGRAKSIKQSMVKRGISSDRIQTVGRGETDPIVPNDSDEHRQMNRRVEIEILTGAENINIEHFVK
jgi:outer membrane protein OmpA-like peptidoglycan-associated protein